MMFTEYIELLESFKKSQFSKLTEKIIQQMLELLHSPKFNARLTPYLSTRNEEGLPFTDYSSDPDPISQIKKIVNSLYHARTCFIDLEHLNLTDLTKSLPDLLKLYNHTTHESYEASYLLTHLDVDLRDLFREEIALLTPLFNQFQIMSTSYAEKTKKLLDKLEVVPLSYKAGDISGIALEQMQPLDSEVDYSFLTQFSADLPGYIEKITQYISQYSAEFLKKEPSLNNEKITELQNTAYRLFNDLENLKGNTFFLSFKVLNYIHIIRNILTLSMSALEQMGNLSESSQDAICHYLSQIKYQALPQLFALTDKIEINGMLTPGTLSLPLMKQVKAFYKQLTYYASKPVNFAEKGRELEEVEDSHFQVLRLNDCYKRIDAANKSLFEINKAQHAFNAFFQILEDPLYVDFTLDKLPLEVKKQLANHYKLLKPYMLHIDNDLDELIVKNLLDVAENLSTRIVNHVRWLRNITPTHHIQVLLSKKTALQNYIQKKINTQLFYIELNQDLIQSVKSQAELVLSPYKFQENIFTINEAIALDKAGNVHFKHKKNHTLIANPELLTAEQALDLSLWYRSRHHKLVQAIEAYQEFYKLLQQHTQTKGTILHFNKLNGETSKHFQNLYAQFQPYLLGYLAGNEAYFDPKIVQIFSNTSPENSITAVNLFIKINDKLLLTMTSHADRWARKSKRYLRLADQKFNIEQQTIPLVHNPVAGERAYHILPHTHYSKFINEFRNSMYEFTSLFNKAMNAQLQRRTAGLPFPELEHKELVIAVHQTMAQSHQVKAIKQIFNSLYHLEGAVNELEQLTSKQFESVYVYHLFLAYGHIHQIYKYLQSLRKDTYFGFIAQGLLNQTQTFYSSINHQIEAYQVAPDDVPPSGQLIKFNPLWYTLNAFFLIPNQVNKKNVLSQHEQLTLQESAKKSALRIEKIFKSSHSYFKLFIQSPYMFFLYKKLIKQLNYFTSTIHDTSLSNLNKFKSNILTPLLSEVDSLEDKLGLKPGILSDTLDTIINEYYKGLLHGLHLTSKIHQDLVLDTTPLITRKDAIHKKLSHSIETQIQFEKRYTNVERLYLLLFEYNNLMNLVVSVSPQTLEQYRIELIEVYKLAYPDLLEAQLKFAPIINDESIQDTKYDLLFVDIFPTDKPIIKIRAVLAAMHHYYLGEIATYKIQIESAKEKLAHLKDLEESTKQANQLFIDEYPSTSFDKQLEDLDYCRMGLRYLGKEYRKILKEYLITFKDQIISEARNAEDINLKIEFLIKDRIDEFKPKHFAPYYHLDSIKIALDNFEKYFKRASTAIEKNQSHFESKETLKEKITIIHQLVKLSNDTNLSVQQRLEQLTLKINDPTFKTTMRHYHHAESFGYIYLKQCIIALLEALHLYTSERKGLVDKLSKTLVYNPESSKLSKRFGLFSASSSVVLVNSAHNTQQVIVP